MKKNEPTSSAVRYHSHLLQISAGNSAPYNQVPITWDVKWLLEKMLHTHLTVSTCSTVPS